MIQTRRTYPFAAVTPAALAVITLAGATSGTASAQVSTSQNAMGGV
ncbi:MAG: hypothetical protein AAFR76_09610 [Planctomycetota bacterium]